MGDVVDPHEPGVLGVAEVQFGVVGLQRGMAHRHVVGDRAQIAGAGGQHDRAHVVTLDVAPEHQGAVGLAMRVLEHLALPRTAGPFVHEGHDVVVGGDHLHRGAVGHDPALVLTDVDEHPVHALLGARPRVEVVAEQLVEVVLLAAVVDHHLLPVEVGVPEGWGDVEHRTRDERVGQVVDVDDPLQQRQPEGEEAGVGGGDDHRGHPGVVLAGDEREHGQLLLGKPFQGGVAQRGELGAEPVPVPGLVRGQLVADDEGVRVASAHVGLDVVGAHAIAHGDRHRLHDASLARHVVGHLRDPVHHGHVRQLVDRAGHGHLRGPGQDRLCVGGEGDEAPGFVHGSSLTQPWDGTATPERPLDESFMTSG